MGILEQVRKWIDGEATEHGLEEAARNAQVRPHSESEAFIVRVARAIEDVMQREIVTLPQGAVVIPTEYIIFLGIDDDEEWQGAKRRGLEKGLHYILTERALELTGGKSLESISISIKLKKDPTIESGDFRVNHSWADSLDNQQTELLLHTTIDSTTSDLEPSKSPDTAQIPETPIVPEQADDAGFEADISIRPSESFRIEIWQDSELQNTVPVYKDHLIIGRGSKSRPVDIALVGDIGISRHHLHLNSDADGRLTILHEGRNPTIVNGIPLRAGESMNVKSGTRIEICSYSLVIRSD